MFGSLLDNIILKIRNFVFSNTNMTDFDFLEKEISRWKNSPERLMQIKGSLYYIGDHDIKKRMRTVIGENGDLEVVGNLPNNRIVDNQYSKMVDQKANYLLGQPFTIDCENKVYKDALDGVFTARFMRVLKNSGKYAYNNGIVWLYPYYDSQGKLDFRLLPGYEVLPFWEDNEHTRLQLAVRLYLTVRYRGNSREIIERVEIYDNTGIHKFILDSTRLRPDGDEPYMYGTLMGGTPAAYNWDRIPLIPLKANEQEMPLLKRVKSLQDGINIMLSDFENNMQEDARNTILVLKNYDGTNLGEFRRNLATYGAVKVRYDGETKGGVETLEISVNADNYKAIIEIFKKALIENAMGYDAKDDRLGGNPNQMNIQSMYSDIDLDANELETEYQAAFDEILWFVNMHLINTGQGDFEGEKVKILFNRDLPMNEAEKIENCQKSVGILSDETVIANHPWVDDPVLELERLKEQNDKEMRQYDPFSQMNQTDPGGDDISE